MTPETKLKAQNIGIITGIGLIFGLLYNYLYYPHSLTEFLEAGTISILLGLVVGVLENFVFVKVFQRITFLTLTLIRATLYALLTSVILCLVLSIEISMVEQISYSEAVVQYLKSPLFRRDFQFSFFFVGLMLFIFEIIVLIGRANFVRLILGRYHQPHEVTRIFMFVDIKGSTTIAEKLSNKDYSAFIRDYFYDVSDAIMMFGGEIYQYVGDEIIVVWPRRKDNSNCIRSFFKMDEVIQEQRQVYLDKYGFVPEFKAGIHIGKAIITSVGKQKKELVYHGDVLNTTSRIEGKCNELGQRLLVSSDLLAHIHLDDDFTIEEKGEIELRGKERKLPLYGISAATATKTVDA